MRTKVLHPLRIQRILCNKIFTPDWLLCSRFVPLSEFCCRTSKPATDGFHHTSLLTLNVSDHLHFPSEDWTPQLCHLNTFCIHNVTWVTMDLLIWPLTSSLYNACCFCMFSSLVRTECDRVTLTSSGIKYEGMCDQESVHGGSQSHGVVRTVFSNKWKICSSILFQK